MSTVESPRDDSLMHEIDKDWPDYVFSFGATTSPNDGIFPILKHHPERFSPLEEEGRVRISITDAIGIIYPHLPYQLVDDATAVLEAVLRQTPSNTKDDTYTFLRGSSAKRLLYTAVTGVSEPPGWRTPRRIVREQLQGKEYDQSGLYGLRTIAEHTPEMDIVLRLVEGQTAGEAQQLIQSQIDALREQRHFMHEPTIQVINYNGISVVNLVFNDQFILSIRLLPSDTVLWEKDCRLSALHTWSEMGTIAPISPKGIVINLQRIAALTHDYFSFPLIDSKQSLPSARIIEMIRSRIDEMLYRSPNGRPLPGGYIPDESEKVDSRFADSEYWNDVFASATTDPALNPVHGQRISEIQTLLYLWLLIEPTSLFAERNQAFWSHFKIAETNLSEDHFLGREIYEQRFREDILTVDESGPARIMQALGLQHPAEVLELLKPIV